MQVEYKVIRSKRKTVAIQIHPDGSIIVRAPLKMPARDIHAFVEEKAAWIAKHLPKRDVTPFTAEEIRELAEAALEDIPKRVQHYAPMVGVTYGRITIRSQRSRWGSCSSKGNLNFNCLLMLCPEEVRDYVVIHELCHLIEFNHSRRFWSLVEKQMPEYEVWKKWLKTHGSELGV